MKRQPAPTSDSLPILHKRYYADRPDRLAELSEERTNADIARRIVRLRTRAGLSRRDLAKLAGITPSAICRLEDADHDGHSVSMLCRIAAVLHQRVEIRFVSQRPLNRGL